MRFVLKANAETEDLYTLKKLATKASADFPMLLKKGIGTKFYAISCPTQAPILDFSSAHNLPA